jgi:thiol-disulfide isomerase/thioredoxin
MAKQVIKFYADWCGPCSVYAPSFEKIKQELQSDEITFLEINVENDPDQLAKQYGVKGIPLTILLENGVKVKEQSGRIPEESLKRFILN